MVLVFAALMLGCGPSEEVRQKLDELVTISAQKDSLLQEVAGFAEFMSDVNAELAEVKLEESQLAQGFESPMQASRDSVILKIEALNRMAAATGARLEESRRRVRSLTNISDSLRTTLERTITNYEQMLQSQRLVIDSLGARVQGLEAETVRLAATVDTLSATVDTLTTEANTVYYAIGTRDELVQRGLVTKEGGSRFLFIFGKRGETLVPARDLQPEDFTPLDRRTAMEIALPDSLRAYRIVSRQDLTALGVPPDEKGRLRVSIVIADPERFWAASKFLIVVEQ